MQEEKPNDFSLTSWYELLASLLYIEKNRESWKIEDGKDVLFDTLIKHKPQFSMDQCECAYAILKKMVLYVRETKYVNDKLKIVKYINNPVYVVYSKIAKVSWSRIANIKAAQPHVIQTPRHPKVWLTHT